MGRLVQVLLLMIVAQHAAAATDFWGNPVPNRSDSYPVPSPLAVVDRADEIPQLKTGSAPQRADAASRAQKNAAVSLQITGMAEQSEMFGDVASGGYVFLVVSAQLENVHPRQKVSKDALEGKADRTMGVGGLSRGGKSESSGAFVEKDVAYKIPKLSDHIYVLADGQAISIDEATGLVPGGIDRDASLTITGLGDMKELQLAFEIPDDAGNVALQLFDYSNGHILVALRGDPTLAGNATLDKGDVLAQVSTDVVELAALGLDFANEYDGEAAGDGWQFAIVRLGGQSVSGSGGMGSILQFDPTKYMWVVADGGYIYYASSGSTDAKGNIRFTPEIYQQQEVAFRVPASADRLSMGLRINRDVMSLSLTDSDPAPMPNARTSHQDGDVMEILLHGTRREGDYLVLDLGIKSIVEGQGLEVRAAQQFLLQTAAGELKPDKKATAALAGHPPDPFVVPPGTSVRFELAFRVAEPPTALRVRGFRSEGRFEL